MVLVGVGLVIGLLLVLVVVLDDWVIDLWYDDEDFVFVDGLYLVLCDYWIGELFVVWLLDSIFNVLVLLVLFLVFL